jgi:2-dehydro-3-deoxyphosphogluconate aldolase/(4S)-4-hydroxy-2-oxoglutarate aldolase
MELEAGMTTQEMFDRIVEIGIIPAVRTRSMEDAIFASEALLSGGIPVVEITMTVPRATEVIAELRRNIPELIVGAGTVLDIETARQSIGAGAMFLTSTGLDVEILEFAVKQNLPMIPGALTPSEVMMAKKGGADFIKIFPCSAMGGAEYIRALKGPFPHISLIATGGVTQQTALDFIRAGASAVGVGQDLLPRDAVRNRNALWIHELARRFISTVREGRPQYALT